MKFLHSPSSSSSNTDYAAAILRRLLCFQTLPTFHLDNQIKESYHVNNEFSEVYCANKLKGSPGIVGKLMGLDSMPAGNSIDEWRELKLQKQGNCVLEAPAFVELENDKFIILSFEGDGKDKELRLGCSKTRKGLIESKDLRKKSNQELSNLGMNCKNSRHKKLKKGETEFDSENSSPVSVLEFSDHQEASYSGKEDLKSKNSNSRRKVRGDLDKNAPSPLSSSSSRTSSCNSVDDDKEFVGLEKKFVIGESQEMWEEICKMAERDVVERWKGEDFEEIGVCFEMQILDQLILELFTIT